MTEMKKVYLTPNIEVTGIATCSVLCASETKGLGVTNVGTTTNNDNVF